MTNEKTTAKRRKILFSCLVHSGEFSSRPRGRHRAECNFPAERRFRSIRLAAHAKWIYTNTQCSHCDATTKTDEIGLNLFLFFSATNEQTEGNGVGERERERSVMKKSIHVPHIILDAIKTESFPFIHPLAIHAVALCRSHQFANNNSENPNKFGRKQNPILCYSILRCPNTPNQANTLGALSFVRKQTESFRCAFIQSVVNTILF